MRTSTCISAIAPPVRKPVTGAAIYSRLQAVIESPRPFIITKDFIGPDRRRRTLPFDGPERRVNVLEV